MKKRLLVSLAVMVGMFSVAFAANSMPGRIDGDLYFHDSVFVSSGTTYGPGGGVNFEGEGSLTIGRRLGDGFPRVVVYGGTALTVDQYYDPEAGVNINVPENRQWKGIIYAPNAVLSIPFTHVTWEEGINHTTEEGELNIAVSFGFESFHETYKFSPPAYGVFPLNVPDGAKVWYTFHSIDPENPGVVSSDPLDTEGKAILSELNYCIVEDGMCIVEIEEMSQILFLEESFEKCPRSSVPNGHTGVIPYCVITCDEGYELDDTSYACYRIEGEEGEEGAPVESVQGKDPVDKGMETVSYDEAWKGRYRDSGLDLVNTEGLEGKELRDALRYNAEMNRRKAEKKDDPNKDKVSLLSKTLRDISAKLWSWEHQSSGSNSGKLVANGAEELELNVEEGVELGDSESHGVMHSSGYMLPSTGSSTIFIIISILGIGLMLLAFKRQ